MTKIDQIISPKWMLISAKDQPQKNLSIIVSGNKIHDILDSNDAIKKYKSSKHLKLTNHILLPGLINPFSQLSQQLIDNTISQYLAEDSEINREKFLNGHYLDITAKLTAIKLIKSGTTSYTNVSYHPNIFIETFREIGIRLFCGLPMLYNKNIWSNNEEDSFKKNLAIYDKYKSYPNTKMFFCLFGSEPISQLMLTKIANIANELDLPIMLVNDLMKSEEKKRGIFESLIEFNLINKNFTCVDFPPNNYILSLIKKYGINLALSDLQEKILTDKTIRSNISLFIKEYSKNIDLSLIRNIEQIYLRNRYSLDISEISIMLFKIINNNAAKVISKENNTGELEISKNADMISVNIDRSDIIKTKLMNLNFFDSSQHNMIDNVWIAGKHIYKDRKLVTINEHILYDDIKYLTGS